MTLLVVTLAATVTVVLAVLLALVSIAIRAEDRRPKSILSPPPGRLTALARHVAGLHVRYPAPGVRHDEPAFTSSVRPGERR